MKQTFDFASLVVKIKIFGCWGWSAPKGHSQPHRLTQINVLYNTVYCKVNSDHHGDPLPLGR